MIVLRLGGHTFPIGLGGVNTNIRLSVRHLREDEKEVLGLVELAQALFVPTGLEFASGVLLSGVMACYESLARMESLGVMCVNVVRTHRARQKCADAPVFRGCRRPPLGHPDLLQLVLLEWVGMDPLPEQSVRQGAKVVSAQVVVVRQ